MPAPSGGRAGANCGMAGGGVAGLPIAGRAGWLATGVSSAKVNLGLLSGIVGLATTGAAGLGGAETGAVCRAAISARCFAACTRCSANFVDASRCACKRSANRSGETDGAVTGRAAARGAIGAGRTAEAGLVAVLTRCGVAREIGAALVSAG